MSEPNHTDGSRYEDFEVGMVLRHPLGRTVTQADNIWFTLLTANANPIHFDAHYVAQTEFGRPLANSTFTLALVLFGILLRFPLAFQFCSHRLGAVLGFAAL